MEKTETLLRELVRDGQAAHAAEVTFKADAVEMVRADLRQDYEQARKMEPELKRDSAVILQELAEIEGAMSQFGAHQADISKYAAKIKSPWEGGVIAETGMLTDSVFRQMQAGFQAYEELRFDHLATQDGRQVDVNKRHAFIVRTRRLLRSWDGHLSASRSALGALRQYLKDWHNAQPSQGHTSAPPMALVDDREDSPAPTIKTETAFRV